MTKLTYSQKNLTIKTMKKQFISILLPFLVAACASSELQTPDLSAEKENLKKIALDEQQKGNFTYAANLQNQIINLDGKDADSFINLSKSLSHHGYKPESVELMENGAKSMPANEKMQLAVAQTYIENDRAKDAIPKLLAIKTLRNKEYYNALGVAYDMTGKHEMAQDTFEQGLDLTPDDGLLQNNLALSYIQDHQPEEAIKILKPLVKRPDAPAKYRHNLALAYGLSGKPEEAAKILKKDMPQKDVNDNLQSYKKMRAEQQ